MSEQSSPPPETLPPRSQMDWIAIGGAFLLPFVFIPFNKIDVCIGLSLLCAPIGAAALASKLGKSLGQKIGIFVLGLGGFITLGIAVLFAGCACGAFR